MISATLKNSRVGHVLLRARRALIDLALYLFVLVIMPSLVITTGVLYYMLFFG
jgi:hypothetical protein